MKNKRILLTLAITLLISSGAMANQDANQPESSDAVKIKPVKDANSISSITVAIIDFDSKAPGNKELGRQLPDILTARLSIYDRFRLVERRNLTELLKEHQLSLSGLTDTSQVVKVGKLIGAKIMIFGSVFAVDRDLYIVAKIVGVETSQVKGVLAIGKLESNISKIISQLFEKLVEGLDKWTPELLPKTESFQSSLITLKEKLKDKKLPTVAIIITEEHLNRPTVGDPAAETEMKNIFREVGFNIIETNRKTLEKWSTDFSMTGVDIVITGEGFSEFGTRIGGLLSCSGKLEVQATKRESHKVITSMQTTKRAVDLSEATAAKTALQAAGHELAIKTIENIAQYLTDQNKSDQ